MNHYEKVKSNVQTVCVVCRKMIDYDEECAIGKAGTKVNGRVLCISCLVDPVRRQNEIILHNTRVKKIVEKTPKQKRRRARLVKKHKKPQIPSSLRGSYVMRQEFLGAYNRDE